MPLLHSLPSITLGIKCKFLHGGGAPQNLGPGSLFTVFLHTLPEPAPTLVCAFNSPGTVPPPGLGAPWSLRVVLDYASLHDHMAHSLAHSLSSFRSLLISAYPTCLSLSAQVLDSSPLYCCPLTLHWPSIPHQHVSNREAKTWANSPLHSQLLERCLAPPIGSITTYEVTPQFDSPFPSFVSILMRLLHGLTSKPVKCLVSYSLRPNGFLQEDTCKFGRTSYLPTVDRAECHSPRSAGWGVGSAKVRGEAGVVGKGARV